ncbi:MAG: cell division protein [Archaeoglobaceae archaeon]
MKLLTIGCGNRGSAVADLMAKKGIRVNKTPLFKSYAISNEVETLKTLKSIHKDKRFHVWGSLNRKDVGSIINTIFSNYEIYEGFLVPIGLDEEFGFTMGIELCEKLNEICEEPILSLGILPNLDETDLLEMKKRIRELRKKSDVLLLFEEKENTEAMLLNSLNIISMVGEIDIKSKNTGEVVVDTSDVINSMLKEGISVIGVSGTKLPFWPLRKILYRDEYEIKGLKTRRMVELCEDAMENLSSDVDVKDANSVLIVFSGDPEEITMDGMFSCLSMLEDINPYFEIRYGDYPVKLSHLYAVLLFSGIKKLKFLS